MNEKMEYAERWMAARGKAPMVTGYRFWWVVDDGTHSACRLPYPLIATMAVNGERSVGFSSSFEAVKSLAEALHECQNAAALTEPEVK